ncbi:MAG: heme-binding protein [Pseudomonadota bacterium]
MTPLLIGAAVLAGTATVVAGGWSWSTQNVETPDYEAVLSDGEFELRQYPNLVLASYEASGTRGEATRRSFTPLANYIFAKEREGEKIAMTAPVTQAPSDDRWTVSFIMPSGMQLSDLPAPASAAIKLHDQPARKMAAIRFSGSWSDEIFEDASRRLMSWAEEQGLEITGPVEFAYYNDPFTPPFLRRNEVMVPVNRAAQ